MNTFLDANLSMDPLYPTDFAYAMSVFRANNVAAKASAAFYYRDPWNVVNEASYQYGKVQTTPTNPNVGISRPSVYNLSVINDSASAFAVPFDIVGRRAGDLPEFYADAEKARQELGWATQLTIDDMCRDSWNWQRQNPYGYADGDS